MPRPSVTFILWLAIALFIVVNDVVGDTWIAATLTVRTVEWYKVLVPLPYVAMLAIIHARRTAGPRWLEAAVLAALLWPVSTMLVDFRVPAPHLRRRARGIFGSLRRAVSVADRRALLRVASAHGTAVEASWSSGPRASGSLMLMSATGSARSGRVKSTSPRAAARTGWSRCCRRF